VKAQLTLDGMPASSKAVNVSSVPQRSPFRYPGGKTWLVPRIRQWIASQGTRPKALVEPFLGGGIVSLTAVCENLVDSAHCVEMDPQVAAVWKTILGGDAEWLANRILSFKLTPESVVAEFESDRRSMRNVAFQTILRNRTFHGGILAPGAGLIKHGENGKGIASRWYPETLARRIMAIDAVRDRINFVEGDGLEFMNQVRKSPDFIYFIDPPYTVPGKGAGRRLYRHFELDHDYLFKLSSEVAGDVLLTYDNCDGVKDLAKGVRLEFRPISMQNTHLAKMKELLIGRDLDWVV